MPIPSAFGVKTALNADDLVALQTRVARASRAAARLSMAVENWQSKTSFTSHVTVLEPERTSFDLHIEATRTYPHDQWALEAGELAHSARAGLDNLNDRLFARYATKSFDARRIHFPITSSGTEWRSWRQAHSALPAWLVERYAKVQPRTGPYMGLKGLAQMNNQDKHVWLQRVSLALTNVSGRATMTIEGTSPDLVMTPVARDFFLERGERRVHYATARGDRKIIEMPETAENDIHPVLHFHLGADELGMQSYTLEEVVEIPRRVGHLISYVNGDDSALMRYQAVPSYVNTDT